MTRDKRINRERNACRTTIRDSSRSGAGPIRSMCRKCCGACANSISPMSASMPAWRSAATHEPDYLAMNPNGRVPTLVDGDFVLWESNSIMRYLALAYAPGSPIYPRGAEAARRRRPLAGLDAVDHAAGRSSGVLGAGAHAGRAARHGGDPEGCRRRGRASGGSSTPSWRRRRFIEGDDFTIADIAIGAYARRWLGVEGVTKPKLAASRALVRAIRQPAGICSNSSRRRCRERRTSLRAQREQCRRAARIMPRMTADPYSPA